MRIAYNLIADHFRKGKKMLKTQIDDKRLERSCSSLESLREKQRCEQRFCYLERLIEELPPTQREVVKLRYYKGMSFKEIALKTDVSINTALGRMRYSVLKLRKQISRGAGLETPGHLPKRPA